MRGKVTELSVYATYSALSEIELATGGANLGEEFIGDIANVISGFNHSELSFVFLTGQEGLTTAFKAKRYEIFTFFEAHVYSVLLNSLGEGGPYSPVELKAIVERDLIAEFQEGYVADLAWSRISAGFTPLYVRLLVILSVLFSLAFIEPAMYFIIGFLRKRILQFPEPQPNKSPARVTTGS
ncbi:MAG: hypothetical protein LBE38_03440 [Deltaproteobacteria bacterium]|nr:hypothetical protein [Deltaproteobacteria bacterium]